MNAFNAPFERAASAVPGSSASAASQIDVPSARATRAQRIERALADAARRRCDRALERRVVVAVRDQAQARERVADLGAVEEPEPPYTRYGISFASSSSSNSRDCAFERYRIARRRRRGRVERALDAADDVRASSRSLNAA
jgi:hypothetical protein